MSNQSILVSIITPFYNVEKYLEETIHSVLNQTYENWELLLIDDGSDDESTEIAKKFASEYAGKIIYLNHIYHRNRGASASRNLGLANARGKLIAFLDSDDVFKKNYLKTQVNLFKTKKVSMICEATEYWYSWTNELKENEIVPVGAPQDRLFQPRELNLLLYPLNHKKAAPCMCGIIISKEALIRHEGFDGSFTGMYDDQVFLSKIYFNEQVYISSACNNRYRQRPGSLMSTAKSKEDYLKIRLKFLEWFKSYLKENNGKNTEVYKRVNKLLLPHKYPRIYHYFYYLPQKFINKFRKIYRRIT